MIAVVRTTLWAFVGGLWGAALATRGSPEASGHAALVGTAIGAASGAIAGLGMHAWLRRIRIRRRKKGPDS